MINNPIIKIVLGAGRGQGMGKEKNLDYCMNEYKGSACHALPTE